MKQLDFYLSEMHNLLDQLVEVAKTLSELSVQVISEEELNSLQTSQKKLLSELEKIDQVIQEKFWNEIEEKDHQLIHSKLTSFKDFNHAFIHHLKDSHGLIQFEMVHLEAQEEEREPYSKLNPVSSSPRTTKAVNPKKSKKT